MYEVLSVTVCIIAWTDYQDYCFYSSHHIASQGENFILCLSDYFCSFYLFVIFCQIWYRLCSESIYEFSGTPAHYIGHIQWMWSAEGEGRGWHAQKKHSCTGCIQIESINTKNVIAHTKGIDLWFSSDKWQMFLIIRSMMVEKVLKCHLKPMVWSLYTTEPIFSAKCYQKTHYWPVFFCIFTSVQWVSFYTENFGEQWYITLLQNHNIKIHF